MLTLLAVVAVATLIVVVLLALMFIKIIALALIWVARTVGRLVWAGLTALPGLWRWANTIDPASVGEGAAHPAPRPPVTVEPAYRPGEPVYSAGRKIGTVDADGTVRWL